jgi:DNA-binding CsgD family transcriptional regulator
LNLGLVYLMDGAAASAHRLLIGVLDTARATGEKTFVHIAILGLAVAVSADGDPTVAATLYGAADHQYEQAGQAFDALDVELRAGAHARLLDALGEAALDAACQHGRTLSQADAIALAVGTVEPDPGQPDPGPAPAAGLPAVHCAPADSPAGPLSARERQIMALLAGGASNAKIATTLFVTPNTVRTHLDRIRDKTGARNRAELTRYAIQAGIEPVVPAL